MDSRAIVPFRCGSYNAHDSREGIYVATPNAFHKNCAIAAAERGKHVICEKPPEWRPVRRRRRTRHVPTRVPDRDDRVVHGSTLVRVTDRVREPFRNQSGCRE
ncbi:hypothetical protein EA462_03805 [Natrarchaeobius halalkaliphilus]|uniref:Gfo/Idh/MocA-like oxidoreductase N-terminal domain-containing protein n=1 Tax=Natrarchaeobius halalkaliphilus TaxID=1679091 RepID=A0A3N6M723_9EURY|nr:hypothetical protein EA462_03805 [Natrarchaeobius halalkaliphilus]